MNSSIPLSSLLRFCPLNTAPDRLRPQVSRKPYSPPASTQQRAHLPLLLPLSRASSAPVSSTFATGSHVSCESAYLSTSPSMVSPDLSPSRRRRPRRRTPSSDVERFWARRAARGESGWVVQLDDLSFEAGQTGWARASKRGRRDGRGRGSSCL